MAVVDQAVPPELGEATVNGGSGKPEKLRHLVLSQTDTTGRIGIVQQ